MTASGSRVLRAGLALVVLVGGAFLATVRASPLPERRALGRTTGPRGLSPSV